MDLSAPGSAVDDVTQDPNSPYYIGTVDSTAASGDEIRADATKEIDDEIAKGWLGKAVTPQERNQAIQRLYEQKISSARQGLHDELEMRDHGTAPHTLWENATHPQMMSAITDDADSAAVAVTSEEWVRLGNELTEHQRNLAGAINDSMSNWQGAGGDAARKHLADVGQWLGTTATGATLTGRQQEIHSQALNEAQIHMAANPPVQFDAQAANARLQTITDPMTYAQQAQADQTTLRQQQAARQQAARIMTQYDQTIGQATGTPAFPPPPKLAGDTARTSSLPTGSAGPGSGTGRRPLMAGSGAAAGGAGEIPAQGGAGSPGNTPAGAGAPGLGGGGFSPNGSPSGSPGGNVDIPNLPGSGSTTGGSGGGGSIPSLPDSTLPSSYTGTGISSAPGGGTPNLPTIGYSGGVNGDSIASRLGGGPPLTGIDPITGNPISAAGLGGAGGLGGSSGLKGVGGAGGVKGIGGGAGGGSKLGGGTSSGASAAAAEEAAGARGGAAGTAGKAGTPGASGMGAGRGGKGGEDKEHKHADYLEGEPDLFEPEQVVAPPVIGDWKNKQAKKK
ncbi:hypothetical protein [Amycolatopsis alkalitolerans]|uniref:hypothetical protein n=1 Tax=Amycolatopsis alkalitolerans TaxID=2547244 RepID=UPI001F2E0BAC|nr:hypothetical protein [Amycolatopsis alkalitolerans]